MCRTQLLVCVIIVVADGIRKDMETYNEAILGSVLFPSSNLPNLISNITISRPRDEYISTILKPATWGGAIELSVLAAHYNTEISSIDVETGRIDRFEPTSGEGSGNRWVLFVSF